MKKEENYMKGIEIEGFLYWSFSAAHATKAKLVLFQSIWVLSFLFTTLFLSLKKKKSIFLIFESLGLLPLPSFKSFFFHSCSGCPIID